MQGGALDVGGISFMPIHVPSPDDELFVLYIEHQVACVDETGSTFEKFTVDDPVRPDLAGEYRAFYKLVIDEQRAAQSAWKIFRLSGAPTMIIADESIRARVTTAGLTGAVFQEAW